MMKRKNRLGIAAAIVAIVIFFVVPFLTANVEKQTLAGWSGVGNETEEAIGGPMMANNNVLTMTEFQEIEFATPIFIGIALALLIAIVAITCLLIQSKKTQKLLYMDAELGIWNMNAFLMNAKKIFNSDHEPLAMLCVDIDKVGNYGSVYGYKESRKMLKCVSDTIGSLIVNEGELYSRYNRDRFVMLVSYESEIGLMMRAQDVKQAIDKEIGKFTESSVTIRVAIVAIDYEEELEQSVMKLEQTLDAMYETDGNIMLWNVDLQIKEQRRMEELELLDSSSIVKDFVAFYQAKVNIDTNEIVGAEALSRFIDPATKVVKGPGFYVPYFERTGRVRELDFEVLRNACHLQKKRLASGKDTVPISCNFSRIHLVDVRFPKKVMKVIEAYEIPVDLIEVEITETMDTAPHEEKLAYEILNELYSLGIKIEIDDFGSGYSSMGILERVPAAVLKVDKGFMGDRTVGDRRTTVVKHMVDTAKALGADVVCEGVETKRDIGLMKEVGANIAQGFYFSKPVNEKAFEKLLDKKIIVGKSVDSDE